MMSPFLSACQNHQDTSSNATHLYLCQGECTVTCSILQQSSLFDVVQPPFPFHSLLSLSWHSFLQHPLLQMVSISPSEVPKILQLPPLDLSLSTVTLSFKILIPTYSPFYSFIHWLFLWGEKCRTKKDPWILCRYCCTINHPPQIFSCALFTKHVLSNYYRSGTVLGTGGDSQINKTWLMRENKCGLNKVCENRLRKL